MATDRAWRDRLLIDGCIVLSAGQSFDDQESQDDAAEYAISFGECTWGRAAQLGWDHIVPHSYQRATLLDDPVGFSRRVIVEKTRAESLVREAQLLANQAATAVSLHNLHRELAVMKAFLRQPETVEEVAEAAGISDVLPEIQRLAGETFKLPVSTSVGRHPSGGTERFIELEVNFGENADIDHCLQLQTNWERAVIKTAPHALPHICLVTKYE